MGYGNSQVRMNLDRMKTAMEECEATVTAMEAVIGDVRTTMTGLEDDYMGEDADTLQVQMKKYLDNQMKEICLNAGAMKQALTQGLENARYCKDYCQHFVDALGGGANGAVNDNKEIPGAMFCDYDAVAGLMDLCMDAERLGEDIRQSTHKIESVLDLEVVSFNVSAYTSAVRTECDRIDYLGMHRRNLENYASFVETTDTELAGALGGIYDTFMTPESVERRKLEYGSIDAKIEMMQEREKVLDEVQIKSLKGYMSKPIGSLTEEERRAIDEILNVLIENEAIAELELVIDYIGGGVGGVWTDGDAYVAAKILVYCEDKGNVELSAEIYNKLIREKVTGIYTDTAENPETTIYTYEMWIDQAAVQRILNEMNPEDEGLAYYSLQRRSKYTASAKKVILGQPAKEPRSPFELSFRAEDDRLISVFEAGGKKVELASVDMNKVVGKEGIANLQGLRFTDPEVVALLSCIYTDEDIILIGNLANAATEEEYRKVFQSNPDELSIYTKTGLYSYSLALLDKNVEYDNKMKVTKQKFTQLEHFVNGMLYTKPDNGMHDPLGSEEERTYTIDYRDGYLKAMLMAGEIQIDISRAQIENNYSDIPYVREQLPYFAENAQMVSLYAALMDRKNTYSVKGASVYNSISDLGLYDTPGNRIQGADMNRVLFSYCDEIKFDDESYMCIEDGKEVAATAVVRIYKYTGNKIFRVQASEDYMEKVREAKSALSKTVLDICIIVASNVNETVNMAAGIVTSVADIIDDIALISMSQGEVKEAERKMDAALGGAQIMYTDERHMDDENASDNAVPILMGCYDANALLKMVKLEKEGLKEVSGISEEEKEGVKNNIADRIVKKVTGIDSNEGENETNLREMYLLFTGKVYEDEAGGDCTTQTISDIDPNRMRILIDKLEDDYCEIMDGFEYISYDLIESEYMGE